MHYKVTESALSLSGTSNYSVLRPNLGYCRVDTLCVHVLSADPGYQMNKQ